jgi:spermidine/putrescine transport system permease protein
MIKFLKQFFSTYFFPATIALMFLFIYIPIAVLIFFSFNKVAFPYRWVGFSLNWYSELIQSEEIWHVVKNSCIVASMSVILSLTMGIFFVFYTSGTKLRRALSFFYANLLFPEIKMR